MQSASSFLDNDKIFMIGIMLSISTMVGWFYWFNYHNHSMNEVSIDWQTVNINLSGRASQQQLEDAQHFTDINDNNYGALASLALAKQYAERGDFYNAQTHLQKALGQTKEDNLKSIINLRLARVQLQQKNIDSALKTLSNVKSKEWKALAENIRNDSQVIKGVHQATRNAYTNSDTVQLTTGISVSESE